MRRRLLPTFLAGLTALTALVATALPSSAAIGDWPTNHGDNLRSGHVAGTAAYTSLRTGWTRSLDGAVYGSPIVVGGQVVVATENNTVYALDPSTGAVRWAHHLRPAITDTSVLACPGSISPTGITSTPAYDPVTGRIFVVTVTYAAGSTGVTHELWGLRPSDGGAVLDKRVEVPGTDPRAQQQRSALAVDRGNVYVAFGGLAGDCGNYRGAVLSLYANGLSGGVAYVVPTGREAGIWAPGGPAVAADGTVFVAVGNGESTSGAYDRSDSVTRLTGRMGVLDWFAPSSWASDNARDLDLGSMTPAITASGFVLQVGKSGTGYTVRAGHMGGIGTQLASASLCPSYGVSAVTTNSVYLPCTSGVTRVDLDANGGIHRAWTQTAASGSPVAGPGALYVVSNGRLYALAGANGAVLGNIAVPSSSRFVTPALSGNRAFVGTLSGVTSVLVG